MTMSRRILLAWLVAVIGLGAIVVVQLVPNRHRMEDDLTRRAGQALAAAGTPGVDVAFTGRDGLLHADDEATASRAQEIVAKLDGVRVVRTIVTPPAVPPRPPFPEVLVTLTDRTVTLTGIVPTEAHHEAITAPLQTIRTLTDGITTGDVGEDGLDRLPALFAALPKTVGDLRVHLKENVLTLSGEARSEREKIAITTAAHRTGLTVVDALGTADLAAQLSAVPPLMFASDSSSLSPQARRNLWRAAGLLHANPSAAIVVEGHTDSLEPGGERLGAERAEAVRAVLTEFGIDQQRMTISGYGDSRPEQPGDSDLSRAKNRHAELVVSR